MKKIFERGLKSLKVGGRLMVGALLIASSTLVYSVLAAPPGTPYNLGETLQPACAPGDVNCTVVTPAASGANADITSLSGLTTALSVDQGGTGLGTIAAGKLLYTSALDTLAELSLEPLLTTPGGVLTLDSTVMVETENVSLLNNDAGYISDIAGQDLSTADNTTSGFISNIAGQDLSTADNTTSGFISNIAGQDLSTADNSVAGFLTDITGQDLSLADNTTSGFLSSIAGEDLSLADNSISGFLTDITGQDLSLADNTTSGFLTDITGQDLSLADNTTSGFLSSIAGEDLSLADNSISGFLTDITGQDLSLADNSISGFLTDITGQDLSLADNSISGFLTDITGQDLSLADNTTSGFLTTETDPTAVLKATFAAAGDLLVGTGAGTYSALTAGVPNNGNVLTVVAGVPSWSAAGFITEDGLTDLTGNWVISTNDITLTGGTLEANTVTDGTASMSTGTVSDGVGASMSGGTVTGTTLTDGTASMNAGSLTGVVGITASGTVQGGTLTDGTASMTGGNLSSVGTLGATTVNISSILKLTPQGSAPSTTDGTIYIDNTVPGTLCVRDGGVWYDLTSAASPGNCG